MNVQCRSTDPAVPPRVTFGRLRRRLTVRRIARIQFVYCVLAEIPHVTLCATPLVAGEIITISKRMRHRLICTFCDWMTWRESDWLAGPDCVGVLTWDLSTEQFTHRHSGYIQQYVSRAHVDEPPVEARSPRSAEPVAAV
jgi:hypothetical protein